MKLRARLLQWLCFRILLIRLYRHYAADKDEFISGKFSKKSVQSAPTNPLLRNKSNCGRSCGGAFLDSRKQLQKNFTSNTVSHGRPSPSRSNRKVLSLEYDGVQQIHSASVDFCCAFRTYVHKK